MNTRHLLVPLVILSLGLGRPLSAADQSTKLKPGYNVVVDISFNEKGEGEGANVVESDDPTGDTILNRISLTLSAEIKQEPRLEQGKPVRFKVRVPYNFPVDGDEGVAANAAPRPRQKDGERPVYPANLAAAGEVGGVILELNIGTDGKVHQVTVLKTSHPEFAQSAETAVKTWTFVPAMKEGAPVESRWRIAIAYSVGGKDVDWKWRVAPRPNLGGSIVFAHPKPAPAAPAPAVPAPAPAPAK